MRDIFLKKSIPEILNLIKKKKINLDHILNETKKKYKTYQKKICSWKSFDHKILKKKLIESEQRYKLNKLKAMHNLDMPPLFSRLREGHKCYLRGQFDQH